MCNETRKPHVHAEVIKAWADGATIQYRHEPKHPWCDVASPAWYPDTEYRIKPEKKVVKYRRYLHTNYTADRPVVQVINEGSSKLLVEERDNFIKWIDTDWQTYTVEE